MIQISTRKLAIAFASTVFVAACGSSADNGGASGSGGTSSTAAQPYSLKIMVGGLNKQIYLPNMLAQQLGYFKEQNLDVTLIDEASGQSSEEEVLAGQVDAGSGSYNHTQELQAQGKFMETVVQLQIAPGEAEVVKASEASSITSASDLKGKNLGVTELGSGTQTLTSAIVGRQGITTDQVHFIPVGAGDTFIAGMQQGKIDAGMTTEPTISRVVNSGLGKVLVDLRTPETTRAALGGDYPFISVFMKTDFVNSHKDVVQRLVNAYVKTLKWIATHTAEEIADKMPSDYYAGDKAAYVAALNNQIHTFSTDGRMPAGGPQLVNSIETKYVPSMKGTSVDLSKTYTNEFADKANSGS
jgi:NitT/TauT family transport system substrate-binding protein